jgi:phosphotransferase system IIB component
MKTFTITQQNGTEHTVSVDGDDWDLVSKHTWGVHYQNGYLKAVKTAAYRNGKWTTLYLHQLIMGPVPPGKDNIDHIDRNPLNNCRTNLRFATQREQIINQRMKSTNTSGVKGVCWHKAANKWEVGIDNKHVGLYETFEKACEARAQAENEREFLLCESVSLC